MKSINKKVAIIPIVFVLTVIVCIASYPSAVFKVFADTLELLKDSETKKADVMSSSVSTASQVKTVSAGTAAGTTSSGSVKYTYDNNGKRIMKEENGKKTYYINDYYEEDDDGTTRKYIYANGVKVATVETTTGSTIGFTTGSTTVFTHTDNLGSSSVSTDSSGNVTEVNDYFPYGSSRINENTGTNTNNYLYTGKELDRTTGLYYYGARYYDPSLGRFTSVDPWSGDITDPQSLNSYSYVKNNPMKYTDPTGMWGVAPNLGGKSHQYITEQAIRQSNIRLDKLTKGALVNKSAFWSDVAVYAQNYEYKKEPYHHSTSTGKSITALQIKSAMMNDAKQWYTSNSIDDFGRLLHMVQDSYCPSHVERDGDGNIKAFLDAERQDYWTQHKVYDNYKDENGNIRPEAKDAIWASKKLIDYYYGNKGWLEVEKYLDTQVFKGVDEKTSVGKVGTKFEQNK